MNTKKHPSSEVRPRRTKEDPMEVAVFFKAPGYDDYPFSRPHYVISYHQFAERLRKKGARLTIVRGQDTYRGGNTFQCGWRYDGKTFIRSDDRMEFDVILQRSDFTPDQTATIVNATEFDGICSNKWKTYELFRKYCPKTILVQHKQELEHAIDSIRTEKIVAKPLDKEGGEGVLIGDAEYITKSIPHFPYLVQEFIDSSKGIPGLIEGVHDLRIVTMGGTLTEMYVRTPKPGLLLANFTLGGTMHHLHLDKLPKEAEKIWKIVDAKFADRFPHRIYSLDLSRDENGTWKIVEMNSRPGFSPLEKHPTLENFHENMANILLKVARSNAK